jgi:hypothetical protein
MNEEHQVIMGKPAMARKFFKTMTARKIDTGLTQFNA